MLFPTFVGVFLIEEQEKELYKGLPHERGGVLTITIMEEVK